MSLNPTCYTIGGVKVQCPYKAYPSQVALMAKIISSVQKSQNCLLESPTGSGKTLALLCSSLAWQQAEDVKIRSHTDQEISQTDGNFALCEKSVCPSSNSDAKDNRHDGQISCHGVRNTERLDTESCTPVAQGTNDDNDDDDDDDFKPCKSNRSIRLQSTTPNRKLKSPIEEEDEEEEYAATRAGVASKPPKKRVPKIYYGTRTHKQIAQVIRELRKTAYKDVKMCVLASRDNTCIHDSISQDPNKNEICRNMQQLPYHEKCIYHNGAMKFKGQDTIINHGLDSAWDIEDLVKFGKRRRACPYYIIRGVKDDADIIFCPYNYLIDPLVRESMEINLRGNIVILDEAHNIEDTGREAGSFTLKDCDLAEAMKNLQNIDKLIDDCFFYNKLAQMLKALYNWLESQSKNLIDRSVNESSAIMSGPEIVAALCEIGLGPDDYKSFVQCFNGIRERESVAENNDIVLKITAGTSFILNGLELILGILFREGMPFVDDYKVAIISELSTRNLKMAHSDQFVSRHSVSRVASLNFWCLNPGVPFADIKTVVRSIVVTSGTLSPIDSFQSELGISFASKLETNHVIDATQVWVGSISSGPNSLALHANYQTTETFAFQDEIGQIVKEICSTVPHGVLFFVSSYNFLEKLQLRWQASGVWQDISQHKVILCEPRGSNKSKFQDVLYEFYEVIHTSCTEASGGAKRKRSQSFRTVNGALLMAVCRGKISEGLDFTDNYARAVITCGIPFPNVKDLQVELKRKYNDKFVRSRGLLSGQQWYEIQAFRALNQALGRCIRHRNDWGALIMLDSRISQIPKYRNGLSKWIRGNLHHYDDFHCAMKSLQDFVISQKDADVERQLLSTPSNMSGPTRSATVTNCQSPDLKFGEIDDCGKNTLETPKNKSAETSMVVSIPTRLGERGKGDDKAVILRRKFRPPRTRPVQKDYFIDSD